MEALITRRDVIAWITSLPPGERVRTWSALTDPDTTAAVSAVVDQTIFTATRTKGVTSAEVADQFGLTVKQVTRAIGRHNERRAARTATTATTATTAAAEPAGTEPV